jgi:Tfp pilus assembly protein PilF
MDNPILRIATSGQRALEEGRLPAALAAADQLVAENPHQSRFRWFRANVLYEMNQMPDAASEARTVVSLEPRFYPAHFMLAVCANRLDRRAEAQEHFEIALDLSQRDPDVLEEYALFMAAQRGAKIGQRVARSAVKELPDSAPAWTALGIAQLRLGLLAQAESALQRALEIDPHHGPAKFVLAGLYVQTGRRKTARALGKLIEEDDLREELRMELARSGPRIRHPLSEEDAQLAMNPAPQPARPKYPPPWRDPVVWSLVLLVTLLFLARIIHWSWF